MMLSQPAVVTGYSLGAARSDVLTALMIVDGVPPVARVVFGEPKPGLLDFAELVITVPGRSYRNGDAMHHDLVTDVPFTFTPMQYVHPTPIIEGPQVTFPRRWACSHITTSSSTRPRSGSNPKRKQ